MAQLDEKSRVVIEFLFSKQRQTFLSFATGLVHDSEVAKDIVSESYATVWEHRDEIEDFYSYLFKTVKNNCLQYRRGEKIHKDAYERIARIEQGFQDFYSSTIENSNISSVYEREVLNILYDTLSRMPQEARRIFEMKKFEGRSYKEISAELGVTSARIDHTLRKVTKTLADALKDYAPLVAAIFSTIT